MRHSSLAGAPAALALLLVAFSAVVSDAQESLPAAGPGAAAAAPPTDQRHYSYAIGLDIGRSFGKDKIDLDVESLLAGLKDGLAGVEPKYAEDLCAAAMMKLNETRAGSLAKQNKEYLAENAKKEGVKLTDSGLQYKILASGDGATPGPRDIVKVHYQGKLIDGSIFDESIGGDPVSLPVNRVIPGWTEALGLMKVGDKWELTIPSELAYGPNGAGEVIPPHSTLVFQIELLGIEGR